MSIPIRTRFVPTLNGPAHVGHLYAMLVNATEAQESNGRWALRFDDMQEYWQDRITWEERVSLKQGWLNDLAWFGLKPDLVVSESEIWRDANIRLEHHCRKAGIPLPVDKYGDRDFPECNWTSMQGYPYTAYKTALKVIMDEMMNTTLLIRGEDLLGEFSLYAYFCETFNIYQPRQVYIPRLHFNGSVEVSKTNSNFKVMDWRERGGSRENLFTLLALSCLRQETARLFSLRNLAKCPVWVEDVD